MKDNKEVHVAKREIDVPRLVNAMGKMKSFPLEEGSHLLQPRWRTGELFNARTARPTLVFPPETESKTLRLDVGDFGLRLEFPSRRPWVLVWISPDAVPERKVQGQFM